MARLEQVAQRLQARLIGSWHGRARLWFEPGDPAYDETVEGDVAATMNGRWVRHEYSTVIDGQREYGSALIGFVASKRIWQIAWVDSFHTSSGGVMVSEGPTDETDSAIDALGSYEAGDGPRWGWRTEYEPVDDGLVVRHFNVSPAGEEVLAVQFDYERR